MSTSLQRRQRLAVVRRLPPKLCPYCRVLLERTVHPDLHVARCNKRLKEVTA